MAKRPVDALADQRVEDRAHGQRQALAIRKVGQRQADDGEDRPRMQTPMEQGDAHGGRGGFVAQPLGEGVAGVVGHGFGH
ncbi:hypothetical protein D3C80_1607790 [compost metagenome]